MATTNSHSLNFSIPESSTRTLVELALGFAGIMAVLWMPTHEQLIFGPLALLLPAVLVLLHRPSARELGLGRREFIRAFWILPAAIMLSMLAMMAAQYAGTFHTLYRPDISHTGGYVIWTIYQQFLLQDYFMPRLTRLLESDVAIALAAVLFAMAHLPNVVLTVATLVWGAVSCILFRRYRSLYVIGIAQGLLGLCFAVCVPDIFIHHMRVGLGYWHYHPTTATPAAGFHGGAGK